MGDDSEWVNLPTEEKCVHKVWRARVMGYEEALKLFYRQTDEKSPEFSKYAGIIKKFVVDSNAVAQEKSMDAVLAFLDNAAIAGRTCGEVVTGVIAKCINATKQKTREKGMEIILKYVELDKQEFVLEELLKGLEIKQPKVVVGCIMCLRLALRDFGSKVIQIKPVLKVVVKLLEDRDKGVREETKLLVVEIYRWAGMAIKPQLQNLKPVVLQELEEEFSKLPNEKPVQTKFMRSQQDLRMKMESQAASSAADSSGVANTDDGSPAEDLDPFDLMTPVNILSQLPNDFYTKIEAKKWQERREVLESLQKLLSCPQRLESGDYAGLVKALNKVIAKDTNVLLIGIGGKCLAAIARGLRREFRPFASSCVSVLLEKFKEKKQSVVVALREAIDTVFQTTTFDVVIEDCVAALDNKNPSIRAETAHFLTRSFAQCTPATLPKKILKTFCIGLTKTVNDTTPEVRDASFEVLGMAMKVVGEKNIMMYLNDVDSIRMQRIKECYEKAVLVNAQGEPRQGQPLPLSSTQVKPQTQSRADTPKLPPGPTKSAAAKIKKKAAGGPSKVKGAGAAAKKGPEKESFTEASLSDEAVEEKVAAIMPADALSQLVSSNWKERITAMETFLSELKGLPKDKIPVQALVRSIMKKPGLKDTNFLVLRLKLELISHLAQNSLFSRCSAEFCMADLVDKVADAKNSDICQETLSNIAEATSLEYVSVEVVQLAFEQKNPKNQAGCLNWLAQAIKDFGLKVPVKQLVDGVKKALSASNPMVRTAAITLLGVVYMYTGPPLRTMFENEKPSLLQQIDAEFEKVKQLPRPVPTRGRTSASTVDELDEEDGGAADDDNEVMNAVDMVPRTDISELITADLMKELMDKNWKIRNEGLQKVIGILNENKFITPNLGQLCDALKLRLVESNKNLVITTIGICQTLAVAMGPNCKNHVRVIGSALIGCLADSKAQLRATALTALNIWEEQCTLAPFVDTEVLIESLRIENPNLRAELLGWLLEKFPQQKNLPPELKQCTPLFLACLEDRSGDVRKKAQELLVPFMVHVGHECLFKAASKLNPSSKDQIISLLEKARTNLPAKPAKIAKAAKVVQPPACNGPKYQEPKDEYDEEVDAAALTRPSTAPVSETRAKSAQRPATAGVRGKTPAPSKKKKEEDLSPSMTATVPKEQRLKDEKNLKVFRWNFTDPRNEFIEQLKQQMEKNFSKSMMDLLFHTDFKSHTKAIEILIKCIDSCREETVANLDLILKWLTLRFFETNPSMLNKALEYLQQLFSILSEAGYHLNELEASSFIPYLVNKVGDPKDNVRRDVRTIFKLICKVYPASKMFSFLIDGLKSKNAKQRAECLEELSNLIDVYGITTCQPSPAHALKIISQQISDRDNGVRNAALNTMITAYTILGDGIYKFTGILSEKDQSLLEERIKRHLKSKPPPKSLAEEKTSRQAPQLLQQQQPPPKMLANSQNGNGRIRPGSGIQKPSTTPVRKEYALEIDEDKHVIEMPKLIQHDLDDIYAPVTLPKIRTHPPSPSMKHMSSSNDAAAALSLVISQVNNNDVETCIKALIQIDEVLKDDEKCELITNCGDQLLYAISMQFKMAFSTHMSSENVTSEEIIRLYQSLFAVLLSFFEKSHGQNISKDGLKSLMTSLITLLLDGRLMEIGDGPQVVRSLNTMVIRIVEKAEKTNIMSALIKLLQDSVASETCSPKFIELIMKCLWKMVRMLPEIVDYLSIDRVVLDAHNFIKAFPTSYWKEKACDFPLRTIKTILHSLTKLKGNKILDHLTLINGVENSEVEAYLKKVLRSSVASADDGQVTKPPETSKHKNRLSKNTNDMLAEIFKKIGSKENTTRGLNDLYDFKQKYPQADLQPFLKKSSQFFQSYIEKGLKGIEREREAAGGCVNNNNNKDLCPQPDSSSNVDPDYFRERLRILRAQCGLDVEPEKTDLPKASEAEISSRKPLEDTTTQISEPNLKAPSIAGSIPSPVQSADFSDLKMRLERIKHAQSKV